MKGAANSFIVNKYFSEIERELQNTQGDNSNIKKSSSNLSLLFSGEHQVQYGGLQQQQQQQLYNAHKHADGRMRQSSSSSHSNTFASMEDLIHISGPLTEDAIIRVLQARFYRAQYYTCVGPVLLLVNPCQPAPSTRCLSLNHSIPGFLQRVVHKSLQQLQETGCSQSIVLNGSSGSGKTHTSMLLLRSLFDMVGGGAETDSFKHISASLTVLRSLGTAATIYNTQASRMGYYMETYLSDGAIHRTKIQCITIDQSRVVQIQPKEKNYHLFYEMLAGLTPEEKVKYHLDGQSPETLNYLLQGDTSQNIHQDKSRFDTWRSCLSTLGIPVSDILRIMSAVMVIGNVDFMEGAGLDLEVKGNSEMQSVAALLGVSSISLYKCLTMKSHQARGQVFKTTTDQITANRCRDYLAKALYMRTLNAILKRANSSRRPNHQSTASTSSNESTGQDGHLSFSPGSDYSHSHTSSQAPPLPTSQPPSSQHHNNKSQHNNNHIPTREAGLHSRASSLNHSYSKPGSPSQDTFIGVLDMMGFEHFQRNELEQLCINLTAETLQHFYNTHMFKACEEAYIEEGIQCDIDISYMENAPIIELISSQRTGILSLLDAESLSARGNIDTYLQKTHVQHNKNSVFSENTSHNCKGFAIMHFAGKVEYDITNFILVNQDRLTDDVIWTFNKHNCHFGFVTHLFAHELKTIQEQGGPQGNSFRCHTCGPGETSDSTQDGRTTLTLDYHTKLDNLLKTIVQTQPHFIRCIKSNSAGHTDEFERECVVEQLRSLQCLETLHLMAAGFPHRHRYRAFNQRYRILVKPYLLKTVDQHYSETKIILDGFLKIMDENTLPYASANWALGKKHIFLSESGRQQFELIRESILHQAALRIQTSWRRRLCIKRWPVLKRQLELIKRRGSSCVPEIPPKGPHIRKNGLISVDSDRNHDVLQKTFNMYGLDIDAPPPVPPTRPYTVKGDKRVRFPQLRFMKQNYTDLSGATLVKKEEILVIGFAHRRGYLTVDLGDNTTMQVPHQLTQVQGENESKQAYVDV